MDRPNSVIRFNNANVNVGSGSGLSGNGFWDLNNVDLAFDDGAIVTANNFELKGTNSFLFNLGPTGFSTLTPRTFLNDANNTASPGTLISNDTFTADLANYTGGPGTITLVDFVNNNEGITDADFQLANLQILNAGPYNAAFLWNEDTEAIELVITSSSVPEPTSLVLMSGAIVGLLFRRRRFL